MSRFLYYMIAMTFLFSTCDAILTIIEVEKGWAFEANPVMAYFYSMHPVIFFAVKSLIVWTALTFFWNKRDVYLARAAILGSLIIYSGVIGWHAHGLAYIL